MRDWLFDNSAARRIGHPEAPADGVLEFHRRLPGYTPSPLVEVPGIAATLGVGRVWVKDESSRLGLPAFKILGASWAIYQALRERLGPDLDGWRTFGELVERLAPLRPLTLATATDGNHGRAVAHTAALLGLGAHIFVPAGTAHATRRTSCCSARRERPTPPRTARSSATLLNPGDAQRVTFRIAAGTIV